MTAIWRNDGGGWRPLAPVGFADEARLHTLVEEAPHLLPLSGSPRMAVVGREVRLGTGFADLLAVESSGRLAIIEVKLASNAEARRAIIAQVLTYAAYLRGLTREMLERDVLSAYLRGHGHEDLDGAVEVALQEGSFDPVAFDEGLRACLSDGRFRLVLVLDAAPPELVRLVGYLETLGDIVIDLVTVAAYEVAGDRLLVPQRVDPERVEAHPVASASPARPKGEASPGSAAFATFVEGLDADKQRACRPLLDWATGLESRGLARLISYLSLGGYATLLPYLPGEDAGLVTLYSDGYLQVWRSVFERRAVESIARVEAAIAPVPLERGKTVKSIDEEVLAALTAAYEVAAIGRPTQSLTDMPDTPS